MPELIYYLEKIDNYIARYCNTSNNRVSRLAPGISREEIDRLILDNAQYYINHNPKYNLNSLPLKGCEDFYQLYQWHNGELLDYPQITQFPDSIEYISFLNDNNDICWYDLQSTLTVNELGLNCSLFLDEGGGYGLRSNKKLNKESIIYCDDRNEGYCSLIELIKDYAEDLDITLNLLSEKGNFDGDYKERLKSWESIVRFFIEDTRKNISLKWLSITDFLNAALNVNGSESKLWEYL